jgi:hypothetical protein
LERRIGDEKDLLTVSEIKSELSLRFERLNNHSNIDNGEVSDEMALHSGQFKGKCRNCGKIGQKLFQYKVEEVKIAVITVEIQVEFIIALNVASREM